MTYSISEVAEMTGLSIYTLRYYDKKGLLPFVEKNKSGHRAFTTSDLNLLYTICCLKNTGMKISEIKQYITYCLQGTVSIPKRKAMLQAHRQEILKQQALLTASLTELDHKLTNYSSPEAEAIITQQIQFVKKEKAALGFRDPYKNASDK